MSKLSKLHALANKLAEKDGRKMRVRFKTDEGTFTLSADATSSGTSDDAIEQTFIENGAAGKETLGAGKDARQVVNQWQFRGERAGEMFRALSDPDAIPDDVTGPPARGGIDPALKAPAPNGTGTHS